MLNCLIFKNKYYLLIFLINFLPEWNAAFLGKLKSILPQTYLSSIAETLPFDSFLFHWGPTFV